MENFIQHKYEDKQRLMQNAETKLKKILNYPNLRVFDIAYDKNKLLCIDVFMDWDIHVKLSDLIKVKEAFNALDINIRNTMQDECGFAIIINR